MSNKKQFINCLNTYVIVIIFCFPSYMVKIAFGGIFSDFENHARVVILEGNLQERWIS